MGDHLRSAHQQGFKYWTGLGTSRPTEVQKTWLSEMRTQANYTAENCDLPKLNNQQLRDLAKHLTLDKERAEDGSVNEQSLARRWAACYAGLQFLSAITLSRLVPKPKDTNGFNYLVEKTCEAFYSVIRPDPVTADGIAAAQHIILMAFKELKG
jgi:hypothetical protein